MVKITRKKNITGLFKTMPSRLQKVHPELMCKDFVIFSEGTGDFRPGLRLFRKTTPVAKFDYHLEGECFKLRILDESWEERMIAFFSDICDELEIPELIVTKRGNIA